ncbi:Cof-type HAD-IIB family hydrolase [Companilactobacillus jidongensis]|uniref:Cof-type HAD-IIB family hydrolase n=1 Tax=Companilactobacillus jidongensis TaxID=2486006 RepID=UPI000F779A6B|nr:Cof-type HAD-IIB family hydrolase [Companilactobacillus jidongensis]
MSIKLIAFDMDNTLLDSNKMILKSSKAAVKRALSMGIKIVMCTGRPLAGVSEYLNELGISGDDQYVVTYNGAIVESVAGRTITKHLINKSEYRRLVNYADKNGIQYYSLDPDSNVYTGNHDISRVAVLQAWENHAGIFVRDPKDLPDDFTAAKFDFVGEQEDLNIDEPVVISDLGEQFSVIREGTVFLAVMNKRANKGTGLRSLAEHLNILASEVMAFGDERNDIAMFDYAGTAICMKNGTNQAKEHADYITDSNVNDGISKAMDKFIFE